MQSADLLSEIISQLNILHLFLVEGVTCDQDCMKRHKQADGKFKGKTPKERGKSCEQAFAKCCKGVKSPSALCAYIGKKSRRD